MHSWTMDICESSVRELNERLRLGTGTDWVDETVLFQTRNDDDDE